MLNHNFLPCAKAEIWDLKSLSCGKSRKNSNFSQDICLCQRVPNVQHVLSISIFILQYVQVD